VQQRQHSVKGGSVLARSAAIALAFATSACRHDAPSSAVSSVASACASPFGTERIQGALFSPSWGPQVAHIAQVKGLVGFWLPPKDVIAALEARMRPALEVGRERPETVFDMPTNPRDREEFSWGVSVKLREILEGFADYRCQYLGIVVGDRRRVFVSCFGKEEMSHYDQSWFDYTAIDDGGAGYWRIQYDVATCRFLDFDVNSDA
jgi:hypothetical protein